ncbi:MAG TPA: ABC transporter substrate-binding protein, partial [Acidimicrobiales bacterium]
AYASNFLQLIGSHQAAEGIVGWNEYSLFFSPNEAGAITEVARFQQWMQRTSPGTPLDLYAMYGWANAALYVDALRHVGPHVTRPALMAYLRSLTSYDSGGIVAPSSPGTKTQSSCYVLWVIHNGQYERMDTPATGYRCDGTYFNYTGS